MYCCRCCCRKVIHIPTSPSLVLLHDSFTCTSRFLQPYTCVAPRNLLAIPYPSLLTAEQGRARQRGRASAHPHDDTRSQTHTALVLALYTCSTFICTDRPEWKSNQYVYELREQGKSAAFPLHRIIPVAIQVLHRINDPLQWVS